MKISPKPASSAPKERVLPRAISQRNAPTPNIGKAAAEILKRSPKIATNQIVEVVPSVAPVIIPTACVKVTSPALTKPMTVRMAAVEDCITAVKMAPETTALKRPDTSRCNAAPERVAREPPQAFGEMMDSEQEQPEST